jgi:D-beta-D-heptose 7-phosphate kinase/D-beta-D-heptose 1-phosphate adenosyltransferase
MTMTTDPKILSLDDLATAARGLRAAGRQLVFTNGCFDLLHVGHVRYLGAARRQGDALAVGLNSDASVLRIKGPRRPIVPERDRAEVLAALACVDFVTVFDEPDPLRVILAVQPAVLVKGDDWPEDAVIGAAEVRRSGGRVVRVPVVEGAGTSRIIDRILERYREDG